MISALCLAPTVAAQSGYEIRNAIVTPEYGDDDFTYSAEIALSEEAAGEVGVIAVTKFSMKLNIYNDGKQIHTDTVDNKGLTKSTFSFGPYSFKNRFGIRETENASFEFVFYAGGSQVAKTKRLLGPIVKPPSLAGSPQYDRTPYFFQGISVSAGFRDQDGLDPRPTCHMKVTGPIGTGESRSWDTEDVTCRASGNSAYTCTLNVPLEEHRNGGNFSFVIVYNNLKSDPLTFGPYNVTLRPYSPVAESPKIDRSLDYTNFTIQAVVKDASARLEGANPQARLVITRPQKGEIAYAASDPEISTDKVICRWTHESEPAIFNRSDVDLSKSAQFSGRIEYTNDRWGFSAKSSNVSFGVVEEIPKLSSPSIPENVYISKGELSNQEMSAIVSFSKGPGELEVRLTGPSMDFAPRQLSGTPLGGNKYQYKWQAQFDDRHVNNNYTLSLSFLHDQLEGGRYDFPDRSVQVSPVSVKFLEASVTPASGSWEERYNYTLRVDSTVPADIQLQVYDPCSNDWMRKETKGISPNSSAPLFWSLLPFAYDCEEMAGSSAKFRFKAIFSGEEIATSRAFVGPSFIGARPTLVSFSPEGDPILIYISEDGATNSVSATVKYGAGQGEATLRLRDPAGELKFEQSGNGVAVGSGIYRYDWSVPFELADAEKSFNLSLAYTHSTLSEEQTLVERTVRVLPVKVEFEAGNVTPSKGNWNTSFAYSVPVSSSVDATVRLEVYNPCTHVWTQRDTKRVPAGESAVAFNATPFKSSCPDSEGKTATYRFVAVFADRSLESEVYYGPEILGTKTEGAQPGTSDSKTDSNVGAVRIFDESTVKVIGNVTPNKGVIQAWDEQDPLHALTYTLKLENWSSRQVPWVELLVKPNGSDWGVVGEKKRLNPATQSVSWEIKPFWETPFFGTAEFRFLIDGAETRAFEGPEIVAIVSNPGDSFSGKTHIFEVTVDAVENVKVCLLGGDTSLAENIKVWTPKGQCQDYVAGSGETPFKWQIEETRAPPYYDFEIEIAGVA